MPRSHNFQPSHPLHSNDESLQVTSASGPFPFLNPTRAHLHHHSSTNSSKLSKDGSAPHSEHKSPFHYQWRSRDNRKGRHTLLVPRSKLSAYDTPPPTQSAKSVLRNIKRMLTYYPVWDVSYLVAYIFTWGSVIWVINAFFAWLPLVDPQTEFSGETADGGGWTAFIGATVFEVGSWLLMLEAVNENHERCFGWAVESVVKRKTTDDKQMARSSDDAQEEDADVEQGDGGKTVTKIVLDKEHCAHHHLNKKNLVGRAKNHSSTDQSWIWFPSLHLLRTHYLHELGFIACLSQLLGATIFWIAGFTALPGVAPGNQNLLDGVYWAPQVIGGTGFIVSGTLFMLETQKAWYIPAWSSLGWHIGFWNLLGGIGFTLCGALGFSTGSGEVYEASLATFWGSWAFLIGSVLQWYESLSKWSVEIAEDE